MIHSVKFSNIGPFKKEAILNLIWSKKDGIDDTLATNLKSGMNVSKIMSIVGPNASGKSSILRVISFLQFWIVEAWNLPVDVPLTADIPNRVLPFLYGTDSLSNIECVFETQKNQYKIQLAIKDGFAIKEIISIRTLSDKYTTWKVLFSRDDLSDSEKQFIRKNASILFTKERLMDAFSNDIISYWKRVFYKVAPLSTLDTQSFEFNRMKAILKYKNDPEAHKFVDSLLEKFDTGLLGLGFENVKNLDGTDGFKAYGRIKINKELKMMPFFSEGTLKIIDYGYMIYEVLKQGGVLLFDEIDTSFHPEIVDSIIELFLSNRFNPNNGQIILTTHNPRIFKLLHKYQIQLVEKNKGGESETYRLDEVEGVRPDENYYAKYMAGAYGARPNIEFSDLNISPND